MGDKGSPAGNSIRLPDAYAPATQKTYFGISKNMTENFAFTYPQSKCVCKVLLKINTFCYTCKKDKNYHVKCLIFSTKLCLLYTHHVTHRFVVKPLYGHIAREDVRAEF
jgi:hypothetical protein